MKTIKFFFPTLLLILLVSSSISAALSISYAAPFAFTDVAETRWSYEVIQKMSEGGLIQGYGNGKYGPADKVNLDQLATIICRAVGHDVTPKDGEYWGAEAVRYCVESLQCIPAVGSYTAANYSKGASREVAYYALMTSLGINDAAYDGTPAPDLTNEDIPDYWSINKQYRESVLEAYKTGLCTGMDTSRTFSPKGTVTREQAAAMFVRAGWTTANSATPKKIVEVKDGEQMDIDGCWSAIIATGKFVEKADASGTYLAPADKSCGDFSVMKGTNSIFIILQERGDGANYDTHSNSAFKYNGRRLLKDIFDICYPTKTADAYAAVKSVFLQEIWEFGGCYYPSALRYYDNRLFECNFTTPNAFTVTIGEKDDKDIYNTLKAKPLKTGSDKRLYISMTGDWKDKDPVVFELDQW